MIIDSSELERVTQELYAREPIFHRSGPGTSRGEFDRMMADDFWEVGASGAKYSRHFVLDTLEHRHKSPVLEQLVVTDFACRCVSADTYLVTYQLLQDGGRRTRRSTLWQHSEDGWKILYHQGTVISEAACVSVDGLTACGKND